jgi:hypothetical protein
MRPVGHVYKNLISEWKDVIANESYGAGIF